jgi:hypothetical protein
MIHWKGVAAVGLFIIVEMDCEEVPLRNDSDAPWLTVSDADKARFASKIQSCAKGHW